MKKIRELNLDGYAIGGLAVGESAEEMYRVIEAVTPEMPADKPRYLMGVGTPGQYSGGGTQRSRSFRLRHAFKERPAWACISHGRAAET